MKDARDIRLLSREGKVRCVERCYAREGRSSLVFAFGLAFAFGWMGEGRRKSTERERWVVRPSEAREGLELDEITGEVCKEGGREVEGSSPFHVSCRAREFLFFPATTLQSGRSLASPPAIEDARRAGGRRGRVRTLTLRGRGEGERRRDSGKSSLSLSPLFLCSELV